MKMSFMKHTLLGYEILVSLLCNRMKTINFYSHYLSFIVVIGHDHTINCQYTQKPTTLHVTGIIMYNTCNSLLNFVFLQLIVMVVFGLIIGILFFQLDNGPNGFQDR